MNANSFSYIPFYKEEGKYPLGNFIPPLPKGVFPTWIEKNGFTDYILIDPISANPYLSIELASHGYKVLSARSNPIIWLITEISASAPERKEITSVINILLNTRYGNETLSDHLQSLYQTPCASCGKMIQADGFVWEKGRPLPVSRVYHCQFCADEGEREITHFDEQNLIRLGNLGIHRSRAFNRIGSENEYEQESLNAALDCYLPRALYVCMLLANRLDRMSLDKSRMRYLRAALLLIFNDAHSLKHWPLRDYRFLKLSLPTKYFEKNLFLSLQNVPEQWRFLNMNKKVKVTYWPNLPLDEGGICFYHRKLSETKQLIP
ncbi:MAG: hypothetical protein J7L66_00110, partial [Anaerolineaceae bacterium]|nr:hypothetical protein [Anaerolineaceae bacterium]